MSRWTHLACVSCWRSRNKSREPHAMRDATDEPTASGIYMRQSPEETPCRGIGLPIHEE